MLLAVVRGENTPKRNFVSNSQTPGHESDTLNTELPEGGGDKKCETKIIGKIQNATDQILIRLSPIPHPKPRAPGVIVFFFLEAFEHWIAR